MLKEREQDISNYKPNIDGLEHINQVGMRWFLLCSVVAVRQIRGRRN